VRERTGLGCSIGLGPNKLVAKVASDADKPDGFVRLSAPEARERFATYPPKVLPGIGPKTAARLEQRGIATLAALAATPETDLCAWFGTRLPLAELPAQPLERAEQRVHSVQVDREGRLARLRLWFAHRLERPLVLKVSEPPEVGAHRPSRKGGAHRGDQGPPR